MSRRARVVGGVLAGGLILGAGGVIALGSLLTAPVPREIGPPPEDLRAEAVAIPSASGDTLAAWHVPADSARGSVVLMHGIRADRRALVDRARLFRDAGYAVLLFDFQAHGESPGDRITLGWQERHDAIAATAWMRQRHPGRPLAVVAQSMGGAAALYAGPDLEADALVVESVYGSVREATENRLTMRIGPLGRPLAPLLTGQIEWRLGVSPDSLAPAEAVRQATAPILVAVGTDDAHATPREARRIYAHAPTPKRLWLVSGAAHQDLYRFAPEAYREQVLGWLRTALEVRPLAPEAEPAR
ncbi:MAG: alpha/beta hydrolase [Bacteroidota bacterium]